MSCTRDLSYNLTIGKIGGGFGETVEFYRGELEIIAVPQILRSAISSGTHPIILVAPLFWVPALRAQDREKWANRPFISPQHRNPDWRATDHSTAQGGGPFVRKKLRC